MKKNIKLFILLLIIIFPLNVKGISTYNDAVKFANNYIYELDDYEKYLLLSDEASYIFENNSLVKDKSEFKNGGFISRTEFNIINRNGTSYLSPGIKYWTLSDGETTNSKNIISYRIESLDKNKKTGVRVTEYLKPKLTVNGSGTFNNPYTISNVYIVTMNCDRDFGSIISDKKQYVSENETVTFKISTKYGYEYNETVCSESQEKYESTYNSTTSELSIYNVLDDLNCNVLLNNRKYDFVIENNGGTYPQVNGIEIQKISLIFDDGWYYGSYKINKLSAVPFKNGYLFDGYYFTEEDGNEIQIVDNAGNINNEKIGFLTKDLSEYKLIAKYKPIKYILKYNGNGSTSGYMSNTQHEYDKDVVISDCAYVKPNYSFQGWSLTKDGTIAYKKGEIHKNLAINEGEVLNLYAIWKEEYKCESGTLTYDDSKGYVCLTTASTRDNAYACNCSTCSSTTCDTCSSTSCSTCSSTSCDTCSSTSCQRCSSPYSCNCTRTPYGCNCRNVPYGCNCRFVSKTCSRWVQNEHGGNWGWGGHMENYECGSTQCSSTCYDRQCQSVCYSQSCSTCYNYYDCNCSTSYYQCNCSTSHYQCNCVTTPYQCNCSTSYYTCNCQTCYSTEYYCPSGWNVYSGSGSSTKCYKPATLG